MCDLRYEALDARHAEGLLKIWTDADVIRYTNMTLPCAMEDVHARVEKLKAFDVFAVIQGGELIGIIGCPPISREKLQFGLFYQFRKSSWGRGNATIAVKWLINYMHRQYKALTLFADVVVGNTASERILQKNGFELISEELLERDGRVLEVHNYRFTCG